MTTSRSFDITLLGATGFTGGLAAKYLAANAPADAKLALAGRNRAKLEAVAASLGREVAIIVVDNTDDATGEQAAEQSEFNRPTIVETPGEYSCA